METFDSQMAQWAALNLQNCIGVDECMKVCPVVDQNITIAELNDATGSTGPLTDATLKFASDCIQCGRCDVVCPTAAGRSILMVRLKQKMHEQGKAPAAHEKYLSLKGYDKSAVKRGGFNQMMKAKWRFTDKRRHKLLSSHIDKDQFRNAEYLFYFGCYIFTGEDSAVQTIELADKLGIDYEVLGGVASCCGWPSFLFGRMDEAERYHERLRDLVLKSSPRYVVTGCAECYMSLAKIKEKYEMEFEPLTTPQWLEQFDDALALKNNGERVTYHDSCHISRKIGMPQPARDLLGKMSDVVEMPRSGAKDTFCCGYWGLRGRSENEAQLKALHLDRYAEAKGTGSSTMVVECVTCLESFSKDNRESGVEVRDIVGMVHEQVFGTTE